MNWGRYFLSLSVAALLTLIADVVLNAVIFRDVYARSASLFLPINELNARVWRAWAAFGIRQGLQFGLLGVVFGTLCRPRRIEWRV